MHFVRGDVEKHLPGPQKAAFHSSSEGCVALWKGTEQKELFRKEPGRSARQAARCPASLSTDHSNMFKEPPGVRAAAKGAGLETKCCLSALAPAAGCSFGGDSQGPWWRCSASRVLRFINFEK